MRGFEKTIGRQARLSTRVHRLRAAVIVAATTAAWSAANLGSRALGATGPDTWQGNADSTDWISPENWTGTNTPPNSGDSLVFTSVNNSPSNILTDTLTSSTFAVAGITFGLGAVPYTMTGNSFELTGAITDSETTNPQIINNPIVLGASESIVTAAGANITLGGTISGAFNLTATGPGVVNLTGANTFNNIILTAGTAVTPGTSLTVSPGTAALSQNGNFSVGAFTTLTLNSGSGGITEAGGTNTNVGTTILSGTGVINYNSNTANSGTFLVNMATPATVVNLNGTTLNPFTGTGSLIIEQGTVIALSGKNNAGLGTAVVTLGDVNGGTDGTNPTATLQGQQSFTSPVNVVGQGTGSNIIAASNGRTYSGTVTLSDSNVTFQPVYFTAAAVTINPTLSGTGNVTLNSTTAGTNYNFNYGGTTNAVGAIATQGVGSVTLSSVLGANITRFTQGSTGTTVMSSTGSFTGGTFVNSGTLTLSSTGKLASNVITVGPTSGTATMVLQSAISLGTGATINAVTTNGTPKIYLAYATATPMTIFELEINGTPVPVGTYSSSSEPTADPTLFGANTGALIVTNTPEPAALSMIAFAGAALMRRRRNSTVMSVASSS